MRNAAPRWIKVVRHLSRFDPEGMTFIAPSGVVQEAIAEALGITRANVALVLGRMRERGLVECRLLHVVGFNRRKKVYVLSQAGFVAWGELRAQ